MLRYRRAFVLQVAIIANHQSGRDTHLRALRVHGPQERFVLLTAASILILLMHNFLIL